MMDGFDAALEKISAGAYVHFASSDNADMRYLTRFTVHDPVLYVRRKGEKGTLVVPRMEYERACSSTTKAEILSRSDTDFFPYLEEEHDPLSAYTRIIIDLAGEEKIAVPEAFPFGLAYELQKSVAVIPDGGIVEKRRTIKSNDEAAEIRKAQEAAQEAIRLASDLIAGATPVNGILYSDGEVLTSERLRACMHRMLLDRGYSAHDTIVSCGKDSSMPHMIGSGPLYENEPVVIDCFPRSDSSGYYGDMTRTVLKGEPSEKLNEMYNAVLHAQELAISMVRPGVSGSEVHGTVTDYFYDQGFHTGSEGFTHSLGHGVGLEVHEGPSVGPNGGKLRKGNVITIEPGLYYGSTGGIRIEDTGIITEKGFESFSTLTKELIL